MSPIVIRAIFCAMFDDVHNCAQPRYASYGLHHFRFNNIDFIGLYSNPHDNLYFHLDTMSGNGALSTVNGVPDSNKPTMTTTSTSTPTGSPSAPGFKDIFKSRTTCFFKKAGK